MLLKLLFCLCQAFDFNKAFYLYELGVFMFTVLVLEMLLSFTPMNP